MCRFGIDMGRRETGRGVLGLQAAAPLPLPCPSLLSAPPSSCHLMHDSSAVVVHLATVCIFGPHLGLSPRPNPNCLAPRRGPSPTSLPPAAAFRIVDCRSEAWSTRPEWPRLAPKKRAHHFLKHFGSSSKSFRPCCDAAHCRQNAPFIGAILQACRVGWNPRSGAQECSRRNPKSNTVRVGSG